MARIKFSAWQTSRAKLTQSSLVTFWSFYVQIGGGYGHIIQVSGSFYKLLMLVYLTKKSRPNKSGCLERMAIFCTWSLDKV